MLHPDMARSASKAPIAIIERRGPACIGDMLDSKWIGVSLKCCAGSK